MPAIVFFRCLVAAGMAYIRPEVVNEKGWVGQQVVQDLQFFQSLAIGQFQADQFQHGFMVFRERRRCLVDALGIGEIGLTLLDVQIRVRISQFYEIHHERPPAQTVLQVFIRLF